ncbi:MAG: DUF624 domain-containing protein [Lachnospiraceae bacterium]|nr:DUF624 domain-containing protein [Lachnospiraceae bacterium]
MNTLFDPDGFLMQGLRQISSLLLLNLLTLLFCLPLISSGAALAAMHYVIYDMQEGREGYIGRTLLTRFKADLKKGTILTLLFAAAGIFLYIDYQAASGENALLPPFFKIPAIALGILLFAVFLYAIPLEAKFENTVSATLKNAAILAAAYLPRTIGMMAIDAVFIFLVTQVSRLLPLAFFFGLSLPAFLRSFLYYPLLKKMADPRKEE